MSAWPILLVFDYVPADAYVDVTVTRCRCPACLRTLPVKSDAATQ